MAADTIAFVVIDVPVAISLLERVTGEITPATVTEAIKAMPEQDLPSGGADLSRRPA